MSKATRTYRACVVAPAPVATPVPTASPAPTPTPQPQPPGLTRPTVTVPPGDPPTTLVTQDTGNEAVPGKIATVQYVGVAWSTRTPFDATWDRNMPFLWLTGNGNVIPASSRA